MNMLMIHSLCDPAIRITRLSNDNYCFHHTNTYFHRQRGERPDFEDVKKEHRQYMKVEPVNFSQEHKEMLYIAGYS
jgi:hypothetical protein